MELLQRIASVVLSNRLKASRKGRIKFKSKFNYCGKEDEIAKVCRRRRRRRRRKRERERERENGGGDDLTT